MLSEDFLKGTMLRFPFKKKTKNGESNRAEVKKRKHLIVTRLSESRLPDLDPNVIDAAFYDKTTVGENLATTPAPS